MIPVDQTIVDEKSGNCFAACVASLLEVSLEEVPNFIEGGPNWFQEFWQFLRKRNLEYYGSAWPLSKERPRGNLLCDSPNIGGYVIASVPSRTFADTGHSVLIDRSGLVVHDPNPNKKWQGVNVLLSGDLQHWMMLGKWLTF